MKKYSVFDILGPVMIGPSSSHTAGAARLGKIARIIAGDNIKKVEFLLHGSFAKTYKGHGTDRALVAGILGMNPWDEELKHSLKIAEEKGIEIIFDEIDLDDVHPNTVKFVIVKDDGAVVEVIGSSIGGGNVIINEIDGEEVEITGIYPTLLIKHKDIPGVISEVTAALYEANINIAFMKVYRGSKGLGAAMIFETDTLVQDHVLDKIRKINAVSSIRYIDMSLRGE